MAEVFSSKRSVRASPLPEGLPLDTRLRMDGLELLRRLPDGSVPLVFLDPQYRGSLEKLKYGRNDRQRRRQELPQMPNAMIADFVREISRVLLPTGHLMLWVDKYILCNDVRIFAADTGLRLVDLVTWHKGRMGMGYRTRRCAEYLLVLQKPPVRVKGVWQLHDIPDVWTEKASTRGHVHSKPAGLQRKLIEAVTDPGDLVVDPAAGSFSVMDAAHSCGRRFLGGDIRYGTDDAGNAAYGERALPIEESPSLTLQKE